MNPNDSPPQETPEGLKLETDAAQSFDPAAHIARLEADLASQKAENASLKTEIDILRHFSSFPGGMPKLDGTPFDLELQKDVHRRMVMGLPSEDAIKAAVTQRKHDRFLESKRVAEIKRLQQRGVPILDNASLEEVDRALCAERAAQQSGQVRLVPVKA